MDATGALGLLRKSVGETVSGKAAVSVAYSGGLDSSVLAAVAKEYTRVHCYTCVVRGSFDARNARSRAESESLDLTVIELTTEDIPGIALEASTVLGTSNPTQLAYTVPVLVALKGSKEQLMLAGHGADELFGGYAKYVAAHDPEQMMADDLDKMLREGEAIANAAIALGKRAAFPFVSREMIEYMKSLPVDRKVSASGRKILLREVARMLDLQSHDIPKKAAQYSSGVLKEMRKLARSEGVSLSDWTSHLSDNRERSS